MQLLIENWYILVPATVLFIIAFVNGIRNAKYGKFPKFIVAFFNSLGVIFLILGLYFIGKNSLFHGIDKEIVARAENTNQQLLNPSNLKTPTFTDINDINLSNAYIFLDFSGSVKAESLQERIKIIQNTLSSIPSIKFYYFGSCVGELADFHDITIDSIKSIQSRVCNNGKKIIAYTDILEVLRMTNKILEQKANDATICLYVTDDEQSMPAPMPNIANEINKLSPDLIKFKNAGVIFQLIKLPSSEKDLVMSSPQLKESVFFIDDVKNDEEMKSKLIQILTNRLIKLDLQPISTSKANVNNKVLFDYQKLKFSKSGNIVLDFIAHNNYQSFLPIINIDKIAGNDWEIVPKNERWDKFYFSLPMASSFKMTLPAKVEAEKRINYVNSVSKEAVTTYFTVTIPGSNQYQYNKTLSDISGLEANNSTPFNGILQGKYISQSEVSVIHQVTPWIYLVYALIMFVIGFLITKLLKPTLAGRQILVQNRQTNEVFEYKRPIKGTLNETILEITPSKLRINKYNIFYQPLDRITVNEEGTKSSTIKTKYLYEGKLFAVKMQLKK